MNIAHIWMLFAHHFLNTACREEILVSKVALDYYLDVYIEFWQDNSCISTRLRDFISAILPNAKSMEKMADVTETHL